MKVFLITGAFPPMTVAGEADHAFHLCRHLADAGLEVHVLTSIGNVAIDYPRVTVRAVMRQWSWRELPRLLWQLRRSNPDVVCLMYSGGPHYHYHPMITSLATMAKCIVPGVRFVTQFENVYPPHWTSVPERAALKLFSPWVGAFGTLLRYSDRIIVLSDHQRLSLVEHAQAVHDKCVLIPPPPLMSISLENHGTTRQRTRDALSVKPDDFLLVYFGLIYQGKGLETLLEAFRVVASRKPKVRLLMVGGYVELPNRPSYWREMHALCKTLGIDDKVGWTGAYDWDSDVASTHLRAADACVLPFDQGIQLNNSSFAAAATHGLPIITTKGAMLESPFVHLDNVMLCPPQNSLKMAFAIEALVDQPDLRQQLSVGSRKFAQEWFSWDKAIARTIAAFSASQNA